MEYQDTTPPAFNKPLGAIAESISNGLKGVIVNRSQALYGCNRYLIQPRVGADGKVPDSYWVDEADIKILKQPKIEQQNGRKGGPLSKHA